MESNVRNMRPQIDPAEAFRSAFMHTKAWGLRCAASFPAMNGMEAAQARAAALEHYYDHEWCSSTTKGLYAAEMAAIDAATIKRGGRVKTASHLRRVIAERDGDDCWLCHEPMGDDCTLEHKVAKTNGGTNALDNLALCHAECNRALGSLPVAAKQSLRAAIEGLA